MKTKSIFALVLVVAVLTSCAKNEDSIRPNPDDYDVAYISIKVNTPSKSATRLSSDPSGATDAENAIKSLYAIAFDMSDNIICYDTDPAAQSLENIIDDGASTTKKSDAFRVSSAARGLLLIANPGSKLEAVLLNDAVEGMPFDALNAAIIEADINEIKDDTKGFTMINSGDMAGSDTDATNNAKLSMIDISGKASVVGNGTGQYPTAKDAKDAAEGDTKRVNANIERLAAKIKVGSNITDGQPGTSVYPINKAIFTFDGWVLDAINSTFYPWSKKIRLDSAPSDLSFYENNFYTIDPNYDGNSGIVYNKIIDYSPNVIFASKGDETYCLENTMKSGEQRFKNATRIVIRGIYYPDETWSGDWFSFADENYKDLATIQEAYADEGNINLRAACNLFWNAISTYAGDEIELDGTDFSSLTTDDLDKIDNGGQVVKDDKCIRWYQKGLCYYWYEIRHDNTITNAMAFGKYGVVRNNYYVLTLNSVKGAGTPWYPSVNPEDGEKDPDPEDPIDEMEGYIGVTVEIGPWLKWEHEVDV